MRVKDLGELGRFLWTREWVIELALITLIVVGQIVSLVYLDKYPIPISDDAVYSEPAYNLWKHHKISLSMVPPMGGFDESSLIQHGRIIMAFKAIIFRFYDVSLFTARLPSYLSGIGVLWLTYLLGKMVLGSRVLGLSAAVVLSCSHAFIYAAHSGRPDITVCLFFLGALMEVLK